MLINTLAQTREIHTEDQEIPAGDFSSWLEHARTALITGSGTDVACGQCVGCCSSSYFIHIKPSESITLKRIGKDSLFPAPGMPTGHSVLGFDQNGLCPMLKDKACSIYEHRPQTCRAYDCRIFAAAGILAGGKDKATINERIRYWRFSYPSELDRAEHLAVRSAAKFIQEHASAFPGGGVPTDPSQLAILAIKVYDVFIAREDEAVAQGTSHSHAEIAKAIVTASKRFDEITSNQISVRESSYPSGLTRRSSGTPQKRGAP